MEKIQNYEEFVNENILTKTLGPLFVGLLSVLPQPTNAQYNLSNQIMVTKMTNDMMFSKDKSDKSDKEKFLENFIKGFQLNPFIFYTFDNYSIAQIH